MTSVHKMKETGNFCSNFLHIATCPVHVCYIEDTSSVDVVFIIYYKGFMLFLFQGVRYLEFDYLKYVFRGKRNEVYPFYFLHMFGLILPVRYLSFAFEVIGWFECVLLNILILRDQAWPVSCGTGFLHMKALYLIRR